MTAVVEGSEVGSERYYGVVNPFAVFCECCVVLAGGRSGAVCVVAKLGIC